ncbi:MAG: hypothetical protein BWY66_00918 [bacterium ADurb.Bin374]|nr:MAG: hypothetical protein BWY66_00918 [bacterium ADurb.Bin374]
MVQLEAVRIADEPVFVFCRARPAFQRNIRRAVGDELVVGLHLGQDGMDAGFRRAQREVIFRAAGKQVDLPLLEPEDRPDEDAEDEGDHQHDDERLA